MDEVGLALLSASLRVLFNRLASPEVLNFIKGKKLDQRLLQRFETTLSAVDAVLNDAEQKQIKVPAVKKWLDALKDAIYEADDLLDEVSTRAATEKEVSSFFSYLNFKDRELGSRIEEIIRRLDESLKHKDVLGLKNIVGEKLPPRPQSTSQEVESDVYGRDTEKVALVNFLLSDDTSDGNIGVIPVVGLGGIGKTTLAQSVYNDVKVKGKFDLQAWICVSDDLDVSRIMKNIMEDISGEACKKKNMNSLQLDLMKKLKEKKLLVVLDDVWSENYSEWNSVLALFHHVGKGSKIIATTRNENIALMVQTDPSNHLRLGDLSDEDCWLIFLKHASPSKHSISDSFLQEVREDIMRKCKGLPLAAKLLGGLLRSKSDVRNWKNVLKSDMWDSSELENKAIPALRVSYYYLPSHLKRCFVHCSLFPKDFEFEKEELILLWMAENLLQQRGRNMTLEEVGQEYFDDLNSRLFFQCSNNQEGRYVMHDLIHDLAESFVEEFYCRIEEGRGKNIGNKVRHMSYNLGVSRFDALEISNLEFVKSAKGLRTFLHLPPVFGHVYIKCNCLKVLSLCKCKSQIQELFKLKCLRILSLCKFESLEVLPNSIGKLIHLRYLDFSQTNIKFLPDSICHLRNLQTLKLNGCGNLTRLPNDMQDLVNLRHLDVCGSRLKKMPRGMGKLQNLHYLSDFVVGKGNGGNIGELGDLSNLANELHIRNLQNVSSKEEVTQARITDKEYIQELGLLWETDGTDDSQTQKEILEKLQPHRNLKSMWIDGYMGTKFSDWLGHHSYRGMTEIELRNCKNCCSLPPLGQLPCLKRLSLKRFEKLVTIDAGFYEKSDSSLSTAFPSLAYLAFVDMDAWKEWCLFEKDAFPVLRELKLYNCPKIVGDLPKQIPTLEKLYISRCQQLSSPIPSALLIDTLHISESGEVVLQPDQERPLSVKNLQIEYCEKLEFPEQLFCETLESLVISDSCSSLISLSVDNSPNLKRLCMDRCKNLESVSVSQASHQNLTEVHISYCANLEEIQIDERLSVKNRWISDCEKLEFAKQLFCQTLESLKIFDCCSSFISLSVDKFPNLKLLTIERCKNLKSVSVSQASLQNLTKVGIWNCRNLEEIQIEGPLSAKTLSIETCGKLELPEQLFCETLEFLHIHRSCSSLMSLSVDNFPNLKRLSINECENIKSVSVSQASLQNLIGVIICNCPNLEEIQIEGSVPPNVTPWSVYNCPKLKPLPDDVIAPVPYHWPYSIW